MWKKILNPDEIQLAFFKTDRDKKQSKRIYIQQANSPPPNSPMKFTQKYTVHKTMLEEQLQLSTQFQHTCTALEASVIGIIG